MCLVSPVLLGWYGDCTDGSAGSYCRYNAGVSLGAVLVVGANSCQFCVLPRTHGEIMVITAVARRVAMGIVVAYINVEAFVLMA